MAEAVDVVVVGSGPNGLAAAVTMARAGLQVTVLEAQETLGGGARTLEYPTERGSLLMDLCSAVHPLAAVSPFLTAFDLPARGVELRAPEVSYAHPLDGGRAALAHRSLDLTAEGLGADGTAWRRLIGPLTERPALLAALTLGDRQSIPGVALTNPLRSLHFAAGVLEQGTRLWGRRFRGEEAPALLTGVAAHAITPLPSLSAAATAVLLATLGHEPGWLLPLGGSQAITDALLRDLREHGGIVQTNRLIRCPEDLPAARAHLFDTSAWDLAEIMGHRAITAGHRAWLRAASRLPVGNAAAKVDFVLSGPIPWQAAGVGLAGTIHLGGTREQMRWAEAEVQAGRHPERPMVLLSDPSVTDPGRIVGGLRPLWSYTHAPRGSSLDVTEAVTRQIERFAPGFRELVVDSHCTPAGSMQLHDRNYLGGDIAAGAVTMARMIARPLLAANPYRTPWRGTYLCSSSTPPGPGVHGMSGWHAARHALGEVFGIREAPELGPTRRRSRTG